MNIYTSEVEMLRAECKEWEKVCDQHLRHIAKLKKRRAWVGLTDKEKQEIYKQADEENWHDQPLLEAVEAKLKEKNT